MERSFLCCLFHFVQIVTAALFKRPNWKLLPNVIVISAYYSFTFKLKVNIISPSGEYYSGEYYFATEDREKKSILLTRL